MTTRYVRLVLTLDTFYCVEEEEEIFGPFETDGVPWTEQQIIDWYKEHWAEQLTDNLRRIHGRADTELHLLDHIKGEMDYRD